jgi:GAF domain-containing protein
MPHSSDRPVLSAASGQLLSLLIDAPELGDFLDKAIHLAAEVLTPAAAGGITMYRDGQPFTAASSNDLASQVDEIQYGADEGPCLQSVRTGTAVRVDDLAEDERWPRYRPHAVAHGVVSSLSLPLTIDRQTMGALNLYSDTPAAFTGSVCEQAEVFASQVTTALTVALRQIRQAEIHTQLAASIVSHSIIDQAIGILMAQQRCTATTAFNLLRTASQHRNRKLRDIAADIITNVSGEPPHPRPGFRLPGNASDRRHPG